MLVKIIGCSDLFSGFAADFQYAHTNCVLQSFGSNGLKERVTENPICLCGSI
jgi:hypothetical protein